MAICSKFVCCEDCQANGCVWGKTWNNPPKCVRKSAELGRFIVHEVHKGQLCLFPGSDPGISPNNANSGHEKMDSTTVVIGCLLGTIVLVVVVVLLVWWVKRRKRSGVCIPSRFDIRPDGRLERRSHSVCRTPVPIAELIDIPDDRWDLPLRRTVPAAPAGPSPRPPVRPASASDEDGYLTPDDNDSLL